MNSDRSALKRAFAAAGGLIACAPSVLAQGASGHPTADSLRQPPPHVLTGVGPVPVDPTPAPTFAPLATGPYVNFESPPVRPLATNAAGTRLYAANTPASTLAVYDVTPSEPPAMRLLREIPVGIEPVAAAIQPGTGDRFVWVVNHISDDVSVVDVQTNTVTRVIAVGDEPANIVFTPDGRFAWIILQGNAVGAQPPFFWMGSLVTIETATGAIVNTLALPAHTPRAAAHDPVNNRLIVAALHSGNNTTLVGKPIRRRLPAPNPDNLTEIITTVHAVHDFAPVVHLFAAGNLLGPYPDNTAAPFAPPQVGRIVPDSAKSSEWAQVVAILADPLNPQLPAQSMIDAYALQYAIPQAAAFNVLAEVINDAHDTIDHDLIVVDVTDPLVPVFDRALSNIGSTLTALAFDQARQRIFVANLDARNTTRLKPNLRGHFIDHQIVTVEDYLSGAPIITPIDLHAELAGAFDDVSAPNPDAQAISLANPVDLAYDRARDVLYVAALGSGRIGVLDPETGRVLSRIECGAGTRAMTIDPAGNRLFAINRTAHTLVQAGPLGTALQFQAAKAMFTPEPATLKRGRDFIFSTRLSNNFGSSCAMCHIDGDTDHLDWDLGDPFASVLQPVPANVLCDDGASPCLLNHPVKGPMFTQSLKGLADHNPFHWRGDKPQFTDFNEAFQTLLGSQGLLPDADMAAFDEFVKTVVYPPNPFWNRDNSSRDPLAFPNGALVYTDSTNQTVAPNCQQCHQLQHDGAMDLGASDGGFDLSGILDQIQEVPQLRGLYRKVLSSYATGFGLMHDGRIEANDFPTLQPDALSTFLRTFFLFPTDNASGNTNNFAQIMAFLQAFPSNVTNIVGWQVRTRGVVSAQQRADVDLMIAQSVPLSASQPKRCDTVAHGLIGGEQRGYVFESDSGAQSPVFRSDRDELIPLGTLLSQAASGYLVFMAVPPGSGPRLGTDADLDCNPNLLDPFPLASADFNANGLFSVQDLFDFLAEFFGGSVHADFNHSGSTTVQDIFDFLAGFFAPHCS